MPELSHITIRPLSTHAEFHAAVDLQFETWGPGLTDVTSATVLKIAQRVGGVSAGAFADDGGLLGFVFGLTGLEGGRVVHWSHMLAVRAGSQDHGIGRRLKEFQRSAVAALGAQVIYWTYDPLVARNAHLNFNLLGARVKEYARDMYGDMGSTVTRGIGSDRFVVASPVDLVEVDARRAEAARVRADAAFAAAPVVNPVLGEDIVRTAAAVGAPRLRVRIPVDIGALQAQDLAAAAQWRAGTRAAFELLLGAGYRLAGFAAADGSVDRYYLFTI